MESNTEYENSIVGESNSHNKTSNRSNSYQHFRLCLTNITVEPLIFLYYGSSLMSELACSNLDLEKACRVNLNFSEQICDGMVSRNSSMFNTTDEVTVQKFVVTINAWKTVFKSIVPAILLLFFGAWTDRHEIRKPSLLLPNLGDIVSNIGILFCVYFFYELPLEVTAIMETVPSALTGKAIVVSMGVFSYVSAITTVETRTFRIGLLYIIATVASTVGVALGGTLSVLLTFYGIFSIALCANILSSLYIIFILKEVGRDTNKKKLGLLRSFFDVKHITNTVKVIFRSRRKNLRKRICILMVLFILIIAPLLGELNMVYLFARLRFGWNLMDYGIFYIYSIIIHTCGSIFLLIISSKVLKIDDATIGMISCSSKIISAFVVAFAPNTTIFYIGVAVEMFSGLTFIVVRSMISKLVEAEELGKIHSVFCILQSLLFVLYGPMYNLIYKVTIDVFPGSFFIVGSGLLIPPLFMFLWLRIEHKRDLQEEHLNRTQKQELLITEKQE